jgi:hypothetical protein
LLAPRFTDRHGPGRQAGDGHCACEQRRATFHGQDGKDELLGHAGALASTQDTAGLHVIFPNEKPFDFACVLKITGLTLQPQYR